MFLGYAGVAFLLLGLPLVLGSGRRYLGNGADARLFIWSLAWWPHAILHAENPFYSHAVWAPEGLNLAWTTSVPALALLFAPVTLVAGPVAAYNTASVLMPALAAWSAFALCRYLTRRLWPSVVGGFLFGFSTFVLYEEKQGHLNLDAVFVIPLVVLVLLRFLNGELGARGLILRLGPLLALELLISTEVVFTLTFGVSVALVLAFALARERRGRLRALVLPLLGSYLLAAALTAPFVYYLLTGFHRSAFWGRPQAGDLLNYVVPPDFALLAGSLGPRLAHGFSGMVLGEEVFVGLPALVIVALWAVRRTPARPVLLTGLGILLLAALGPHIHVYGSSVVPGPWTLVDHAPIFDNVLPDRLAIYLVLLAAVVVALWLARAGSSALAAVLAVLAVVSVLPDPVGQEWTTAYSAPAFVTDGSYRGCLDPGEIVLPLPASYNTPLLWQALADFRFRIAAGTTAPTAPAAYGQPDAAYITAGHHLGAADAERVRRFVAAQHVTSAVVEGNESSFFNGALDRVATGQSAGGVVVYHFTSTPPSCLPA